MGSSNLVLLTSADRLRAIDTSDPGHPVEIGSLELPGSVFDVATRPGFAFVIGDTTFPGPGYLRVVGTSQPAALFEVGGLDFPGIHLRAHVASEGSLLVISGLDGGVAIVDVAAPALPVLLGSVATPGSHEGLVIRGARAYVADGEEGVTVVSFADPSQPTVVSTTPVDYAAWEVAAAGRYLYAGGPDGLTVMDLVDPDHPLVVGHYGGSSDLEAVTGVTATDGYVYVADYLDGLFVFRECGEIFRDGFESGDTAAWSAP